mgnify:CR=1 FL=1|jgi:hypothetical protein|tara:strand:+ start:207 stop:599 length:393 start_codon:yes stop_codon:yes gene_type:complete
MKNENIKLPSNRSFGIVFFIFFLIIALWPLKSDSDIRIIPLFISLVFLILGLLKSNLLKPLNFIWMKFGLMLGKFVSPIIMAIIYYFTVVPTGLAFKILNKDLLNKKNKNPLKSYWIIKKKSQSTMKNQF